MTSSLATLNLTGDLTYLAVPVRIATPTSQLEQQQQQQPLLLPPLSEEGHAEAAEAEAQPPQVLPPPIPPPPSPSSMDAVTQTLAASSEDLAKENLVNEHCDSNCADGSEDVIDVRHRTSRVFVTDQGDQMESIAKTFA